MANIGKGEREGEQEHETFVIRFQPARAASLLAGWRLERGGRRP
jgi:hypothetical protein